MSMQFNSRVIVPGIAAGDTLYSSTPLSFWGGVNARSGVIQDTHHELYNNPLAGNILCIPFAKGSCSGSGIMLEIIRIEKAPAGIICIDAEPVLALGSVMGFMLYKRGVVIHTVTKDVFAKLKGTKKISIFENGGISTD